MQTRTGDSVYGFNSNTGGAFDFTTNTIPVVCIWDAAGIDTLDMSGYSQVQIINLNDGTFSSVGGRTDNLSIAINAVIENAEGGSGNDTIYGNEADNTIDGNGGNDTINGGAGNDRIIYDAADTAANVNGGADIDTLVIIGGSAPLSYNLAAGSFEFAEHQETDTGSQFWASRASTYNASWQKTAETGIADNGTHWSSEFDVGNSFWYADFTQWFSASDQLQYTNYTNDNGSIVNQAWDYDSSQWWSYFTNYFDTSGNLTNTDGIADDSRYWSASNDVSGIEWWSTYTLWYDTQDVATRQLINEQGTADDGRTWTTTHDVDDIYSWSTQTNWFDSGGNLIETITV